MSNNKKQLTADIRIDFYYLDEDKNLSRDFLGFAQGSGIIHKEVPLKELHSEIINLVKYGHRLHGRHYKPQLDSRKIKVSKITIEICKKSKH